MVSVSNRLASESVSSAFEEGREPNLEGLYTMSAKIKSRSLGIIPSIDQIARDLIEEGRQLSADAYDEAYAAFSVNGGWASAPLMNRDGDPSSSETHVFTPPGQRIPDVEKKFPTIYGLAQSVFQIEKALSVRVFMIQPNSGIRFHADYFELDFGEGPASYLTRIHAVMRTNPGAMNGEGRVAYHMPFGTMWFLEARDRLAHWAANFGDEARYHLVADFLGSMRPEECVRGLDPFGEVELRDRPAIPDEVKEAIARKARGARAAEMAAICDEADRAYLRYDCGDLTPYDLVLPWLGHRPDCLRRVVELRKQFLGL